MPSVHTRAPLTSALAAACAFAAACATPPWVPAPPLAVEWAPLPDYRGIRDCTDATPGDVPCRVTVAPDAAQLYRHLGTRRGAVWLDQGVWHAAYLAIASDNDVDDITLGGGVQLPMSRVTDTDVWLLSLRVAEVRRGVFDLPVWIRNDGRMRTDADAFGVWRGPEAPPAPARTTSFAGRLLIDSIPSTALAALRGVTVYLPPGHTRDARLPVMYLTDGQNVREFATVIDPLVARGELPPVVLVGVWVSSGYLGDGPPQGPHQDLRAIEYHPGVERIPGADSAFIVRRHAGHRTWFVDEVRRWAEDSLGVSNDRRWRAVQGNSSGASFALMLGNERPDVYGAVIAFSNSNSDAERTPPGNWSATPRHYLAAGSLEPALSGRLRTFAELLRRNGVPHVLNIYPGGHDYQVWTEELPAAIAWWLGGTGAGTGH